MGKSKPMWLILFLPAFLFSLAGGEAVTQEERQYMIATVKELEKQEHEMYYYKQTYLDFVEQIREWVTEDYIQSMDERVIFGYDDVMYSGKDVKNMSEEEYRKHMNHMIRLAQAVGFDKHTFTVHVSDVYLDEESGEAYLFVKLEQKRSGALFTVTTKRYQFVQTENRWLVKAVETDQFTYGSSLSEDEMMETIQGLQFQHFRGEAVQYVDAVTFKGIGSIEEEAEEQESGELPDIAFEISRNPNGSVSAALSGVDRYGLSMSAPAIELQGRLYHRITIHYGNDLMRNALLSFDPERLEIDVVWSDLFRMKGDHHPWFNAFQTKTLLVQLNEDELLFLESEMTEESGRFHLSSYNASNGTFTRLREDIWPVAVADDHDDLYDIRWNESLKKLFMQSFLGNVWIYDLQHHQDHVYHRQFRVIPHSTTGLPSLFPSPDFERLIFNDESGVLAFYHTEGEKLREIELPDAEERYVPSETMKWNPSGTAAWLESSEAESERIRSYDVDYFSIAPREIRFFDRDGNEISKVTAEGEQRAVEVAGWKGQETAVIKEYTIQPKEEGGNWESFTEKNMTYFLYDVWNKRKQRAREDDLSDNDEQKEKSKWSVELAYNLLIYKETKEEPMETEVDEKIRDEAVQVILDHLEGVQTGNEYVVKQTVFDDAKPDSRAFLLWDQRSNRVYEAAKLELMYSDEQDEVVMVTFQDGLQLAFALQRRHNGWKIYDIDEDPRTRMEVK